MSRTTQEEATLHLVMLGLVTKLGAEDREKVQECAKRLRECVAGAGEFGTVALALVSAEAAAKEASQ